MGSLADDRCRVLLRNDENKMCVSFDMYAFTPLLCYACLRDRDAHIRAHTHTYTQTHRQTHRHTDTHKCIHMHKYTHTYTYTHTTIHIKLYTYTSTSTYIYVREGGRCTGGRLFTGGRLSPGKGGRPYPPCHRCIYAYMPPPGR